ncbi:uncharacterized protein LOC117563297 [Drosophila albomicans]|uniref:Uncharacterized protein LOC117563297 n=1 Tax=Drosophila albomicans TaxID=7291 RepID=A0A6P8XBR9_DROAB|nr:uncharacterized protein LOC117563297 [Drosophila albomicans]
MRATTISVICVLAIVLSTTEVHGAVSIGVYKDDAHPGKCVVDADTILDEGQVVTRKCTRISCGEGSFVEFATCGVVAVAEPCKLGEFKYPDADYPKCCTRVQHCPDGDSEI